MRIVGDKIRISASDLVNHLACTHLTSLDVEVVQGSRAEPAWMAPDAVVLQELGAAHEAAYLEHLKARGWEVQDLGEIRDERSAIEATVAALKSGVQVIAQGALSDGQWFGRADVMVRVEQPSELGDWSYEVHDCKLTQETKGATVLQLALYSDLLGQVQGVIPEKMAVIIPGNNFEPEFYRVLDYAAYYRSVRDRLRETIERETRATYPEPTAHCSICRWWTDCDGTRRADDHLSLVAGINRSQRKQLTIWETHTVGKLADMPIPLQQRPEFGSKEGYVKVREQARVQVAGREQECPVHELLEPLEGLGLNRLPIPNPGDVFFDLEGDPFVGIGGREYLFGMLLDGESGDPDYVHRWAFTAEEEKAAFEWFVDTIMARWEANPAMHVYHFGAYEPAAVKRLMGRYATREDEVDRMLRAGIFIDLHSVVKQSVRASVEEYSLKALEAFHAFARATPLNEARYALRIVAHHLQLQRTEVPNPNAAQVVMEYNREDCLSTRSLRDWLESERGRSEAEGKTLSRPASATGEAPQQIGERQERVQRLWEQLTEGVPVDAEARDPEQAGRWLLAGLLDWHRREAKAEFWEYFRLRDLPEEDCLDERAAIAGLRHVRTVDVSPRGIPTERYEYPDQETDVRPGQTVCCGQVKVGEVVEIDQIGRTVDIKKTGATAGSHYETAFADPRGPKTDVLTDSLMRIGNWVAQNGIDSPGRYRAARDLVLRRTPRLRAGESMMPEVGELSVDTAKRLISNLESSVLPIQGPPGAGKTHTGARIICDLVRQGKRVGVTAWSHKVIQNLLEAVVEAARECGLEGLTCLQKVSSAPDQASDYIRVTTRNEDVLGAIHARNIVVGGTAWTWAREDLFEGLDVLVVDEAGQMSLANVVAISQAAKSLVLLGDPQQLDQPLRGSHPVGAEASAMEHLLNGSQTIPPERGLFLDKTWRMHPAVCAFTSEVFYEGRLVPRENLSNQAIHGVNGLGPAGLWYFPVEHEGNRNSSPEEVRQVVAIVESLLQGTATWRDADLNVHALEPDDILIVAPYNAQVSDLARALPGARVGTVDKFQGQQAPIVIYSMTTSSPEEAPRGMEFLYSLNRLNVATSRAQALVILVASPKLLEPECKSPRQMQLANALCRYVEMAQVVEAERGYGVARP